MPYSSSNNPKKPPAANTRYWAIRHCDSLKSVALFTDWDDCSFYVDASGNDGTVDYKEFDNLVEAIQYIVPWTRMVPPQILVPPPLFMNTVVPIAMPTSNHIPRTSTSTQPSSQPTTKAMIRGRQQPVVVVVAEESSKTASTATTTTSPTATANTSNQESFKTSAFDTKFELLKQFKEQYGDYHAYRSRCQGKFKGLDDWVRKQRGRILDYQKDPSKASKRDTTLVQILLQLDNFPLHHERLVKGADCTTKKRKRSSNSNSKADNTTTTGAIATTAKDPTTTNSQEEEEPEEKEPTTNLTTTGASKPLPSTPPTGSAAATASPTFNNNKESATKKPASKPLSSTPSTGTAAAAASPTSNNNKESAKKKPSSSKENNSNKRSNKSSAEVPPRDVPPQASSPSSLKERSSSPPTSPGEDATGNTNTNTNTNINTNNNPNNEAILLKPTTQPKRIRKRTGVRDKLWEQNFEKLKAYKETHGTCDVVKYRADPEFYRWVSYERQRIKKHQRIKKLQQQEETPAPGKARAFDETKTQKLLDFGFVMEQGSEVSRAGVRKDWGPPKVARWEAKFELLNQYKEQHGTCTISRTNEDFTVHLDNWVDYQAEQLRLYEEDPSTSNLDSTRFNRLRELGVRVRQRKNDILPNLRSKEAPSWDEMFEQLQAFKEEHGHAEVPYRPTSLLRNWTLLVRADYDKMKEGKESDLTPARLGRLTGLGFRFKTHKRLTFDQRALEWLEYITKHGRDPPRDLGSTGTWVSITRAKYALFQEGKPSQGLTQEQIDKLTSWGFVWETGLKRQMRVSEGGKKSWEERYADLVAFKEKRGHSNVPQAYPELGSWVHHQRREYRKLKSGDKSYMTREKIQKLRAVGFVWLTRKRPNNNALFKKDGEAVQESDDSSSSSEEEDE